MDTGKMYFDFSKSGLVCENCIKDKAKAMPLLSSTVKALKYIIYISPQKLYNFSLSEDSIKELGLISKRYIKEHIGKEYNKLDFLNYIK
jgi:DNA repair protein RecO (recombination protein O)